VIGGVEGDTQGIERRDALVGQGFEELGLDEPDAVDEGLDVMVLGRRVKRALEIVEDSDKAEGEILHRHLRPALALALHSLLVVDEVGLRALELVEQVVALGGLGPQLVHLAGEDLDGDELAGLCLGGRGLVLLGGRLVLDGVNALGVGLAVVLGGH